MPLGDPMASSGVIALNGRSTVRICPGHLSLLVAILHGMGFTDPIFQEWGIGQRFGLSRPLTNLLEWHVRGFADGTLDSEVEISRERLQHFAATPGPYYSPLLGILGRNGIPFIVGGTTPPDAAYVYLPELFGQMIPIQVPSITC